MSVILATWEAKIRKITVQRQPDHSSRATILEMPSPK
jgi:hypothetical protein